MTLLRFLLLGSICLVATGCVHDRPFLERRMARHGYAGGGYAGGGYAPQPVMLGGMDCGCPVPVAPSCGCGCPQ